MNPQDLKYTKDHEWVHHEGDNARVGITDHAQKELGDIVFVELPAKGTKLQQGQTAATIESVKAVGEVSAPVAGEVVEVNTALEGAPGTVNSSPFEEGWLFVVKMDDPGQLDGLMDASAYKAMAEGGA